jgi:predicted ATPase
MTSERARAARPTFELDSTNAATVARICRRLDGIPLALELAAARIQVLSPAQLASRLDDRFRLLTGRERIAVRHQQTLRATIDWSYELLSPVEQHALACLAVFPDTFDLETAEAVICDGSSGVPVDDAMDVLCRLVDKSLVVVHSEGTTPRYRLLETIRQHFRTGHLRPELANHSGRMEALNIQAVVLTGRSHASRRAVRASRGTSHTHWR